MTAIVLYETPDGTASVERDDAHTERDGFVVAYNTDSDKPNVWIPEDRVISISKE
jgi:hypothetical protein